VADRKELKAGFSTIGCGFAIARVYGQLRSVKNIFAESAGARDFGRCWRVKVMLTVGHIV
jgi:hypothetical protein